MLVNILTGWWLVLIGWDAEFAKTRRSICSECRYRKWFVCKECGCPIIAKSRVKGESCPKNYW